jgi:hypothetical protein
MVSIPLSLPADYWQTLQINKKDIEFLHNYLFESETPMTARELVGVLVEERIRIEHAAQAKKRQSDGKVYFPKENYSTGDRLLFPSLDWAKGSVTEVRPGVNPQYGDFAVLTVELEDGQNRMFAAGLAEHALNEEPDADAEADTFDPQSIQSAFGAELENKMEEAFADGNGLVRIAGRWFPRALLVDVNQGHLNLAEAVLDMAAGEPLPTSQLLKDVELPEGVNPKLAEFSLNLALQEDGRFDEVGPAGEVLWALQRLEPENVREVPLFLRYEPIEYDRGLLTKDMLALEAQLDDEFSEAGTGPAGDADVVTLSLTFPHWRAGTLPITSRIKSMFPTAYESPRVRFTLVDGKTAERMPAWIVRKHRYVSGLREWYQSLGLMPGSLVQVRRGKKPGEVIIEAKTHRTTKDWVRTVIVGADGGVVFALLKQTVTAEFNDRMAFALPALDAADQLWEASAQKKRRFDRLVIEVIRELTKLNPQGHVHAQELYAAVNIMRRTPFGPLMALMANRPEDFVHVGDLHFRLSEELRED